MTFAVVKIGGSLSQNPEVLKALCQRLSQLAEKHHIVVVPGGGDFADCVRILDKRFSLSAKTAHRMAVLGMDQYGLLLSELMPGCLLTDNLMEARVAANGGLAVFLPSKFLLLDDGLPNSWDVTSDSIAAYVAAKIWAQKLVLVKDVDGVFSGNPKQNTQAKLFSQLTVKELEALNEKSCVDAYLHRLLENQKLPCFIVNGFYPDRVEAVLAGKKTVGTAVLA